MTYKNKLTFLITLISALSLIYIAGIVFSPERRDARSASYQWLDNKLADRITRIVVNAQGKNLEFLKNNNQWVVLNYGVEYPARQLRIEDFVSFFTTRSAWNTRTSNVSTHTRFGLDADAASRIMIYGENTLLLDLLLGFVDEAGNIYVRKYGENEVRSGENNISYYLTSPITSWYNLRLLPESENGYIDVGDVQRLSVYNEGETQIFSRQNRLWEFSVSTPPPLSGFNTYIPDQGVVEGYIRNVLNSTGDDFVDVYYPASVDVNYSRIVIEFGNGKVSTIRFSAPDEDEYRFAVVDGSEFIYAVPAWAAFRLFMDAENFVMQ